MSFLHQVDLFSRQAILAQARKKQQGHLLHPSQELGAARRKERSATELHCSQLPEQPTQKNVQTARITAGWEILGWQQYPFWFSFFLKRRITLWNLSDPQQFLSVFSLQGQAGRCLCSLPTFPGSKASGSFRSRCCSWRFKWWQAGTDEHTCHISTFGIRRLQVPINISIRKWQKRFPNLSHWGETRN